MFLSIVVFAFAVTLPPGFPPQPKVHPAGIPADAVLVSPCIAGMGEHWANPKNLPLGPIYGTYQGKVVFSEIMVSRKDFAAGTSYVDLLKALPGYKIDHVDIEYLPYGHAGYNVPHYDIHGYYVPHSVHKAFCPSGPKAVYGTKVVTGPR